MVFRLFSWKNRWNKFLNPLKLGLKILATYDDWNLETAYEVLPTIYNFEEVSCHPLYKKEKNESSEHAWVFFYDAVVLILFFLSKDIFYWYLFHLNCIFKHLAVLELIFNMFFFRFIMVSNKCFDIWLVFNFVSIYLLII